MPVRRRLASALAAGIAALGLLAGCASPPAPGEVPETSAFRSAAEQRLGDETHPKILARYGGAYEDHAIAGHVTRIGRRIAAVSEQPDARWTFTVLDSPTVNAFALPGGYVYVTRGLVALADDEAELAGVIGHEIGHVTAGHSALRRERGQVAGLGLLLGGLGLAVAGVDPSVARGVLEAGQAAAGGVLASYSRTDELAADSLGVRYIARAGYDPYAQADFLESMSALAALEARLAGQPYDPARVDFFASHPATAERTRRAVAVADSAEGLASIGADRRRDAFLEAIDGMVYGQNPEQGVVEGRRFLHPKLRFAWEVPRGFSIENGARAVVATGPRGARLILEAGRDPGGSLERFIAREWLPAIAGEARLGRVQGPRGLRIDGLDAAEAAAPVAAGNARLEMHLTAIRHGGRIYRLTALAPAGSGLLPEMRAAGRSFRRLSEAEARTIRPRRIAVATVRPGDTVASLAARMRVEDAPEARFRVLNDLGPRERLAPGQRMKLVR